MWQLGYTLELTLEGQSSKLFWAKAQYIGIVAVPTGWLATTIQYTGRETWLSPRKLVLFAVVPLATILLAFTNELHNLIWTSVRVVDAGDISILEFSHGPAFWAHTVYSYALLLSGVILVGGRIFRDTSLYRRQAVALSVAALAPGGANVLYTAGLTSVDSTPLAFVVSVAAIGWGLVRSRLFDLLPVAHDAAFNAFTGALLVLDDRQRLVDFNPAAVKVLGDGIANGLGASVSELLPEAFAFAWDGTSEVHDLTFSQNGDPRAYSVSLAPLTKSGNRPAGWLLVVDDITERVRSEESRIAKAEAAARELELRRSRARIVESGETLRREIAHRLHSSVQTKLVVLLHRIDRLAGLQPLPESDSSEALNEIRRSLALLIDGEVDSLSKQLYPAILRRGLIPAIESLGDELHPAINVVLKVDRDLTARERADNRLIREDVRLAAYRIAENALSNVLKHAQTNRATLDLELGPGEELRLTVTDEGRGFDPNGASERQGLGMMQDYADLTGGECTVESALGSGTKITATLPLSRPQ